MNGFINMKCEQCNGTGIFPYPKNLLLNWKYCSKCLGLGELNWIENIFGKDSISMNELQLRQYNRDIYFKK